MPETPSDKPGFLSRLFGRKAEPGPQPEQPKPDEPGPEIAPAGPEARTPPAPPTAGWAASPPAPRPAERGRGSLGAARAGGNRRGPPLGGAGHRHHGFAGHPG